METSHFSLVSLEPEKRKLFSLKRRHFCCFLGLYCFNFILVHSLLILAENLSVTTNTSGLTMVFSTSKVVATLNVSDSPRRKNLSSLMQSALEPFLRMYPMTLRLVLPTMMTMESLKTHVVHTLLTSFPTQRSLACLLLSLQTLSMYVFLPL